MTSHYMGPELVYRYANILYYLGVSSHSDCRGLRHQAEAMAFYEDYYWTDQCASP